MLSARQARWGITLQIVAEQKGDRRATGGDMVTSRQATYHRVSRVRALGIRALGSGLVLLHLRRVRRRVVDLRLVDLFSAELLAETCPCRTQRRSARGPTGFPRLPRDTKLRRMMSEEIKCIQVQTRPRSGAANKAGIHSAKIGWQSGVHG